MDQFATSDPLQLCMESVTFFGFYFFFQNERLVFARGLDAGFGMPLEARVVKKVSAGGTVREAFGAPRVRSNPKKLKTLIFE